VYSLSSLSDRTRTVYGILNPVAAAIDGVRRVVLHDDAPIWSVTLGALAWSFVLAAGGYVLFKRLERSFADRL
jgi:ABC-type polysaccharide/polyol phosphate export permease